KARAKLFPGLDTIVSGPVMVSLVHKADGSEDVKADLGRAVLKFPWIGWKKGSGVAAEMTFNLRKQGNSMRLSSLRLAGDGFRLQGKASLVDGALAEAEFDHVQLNRDDRFRLSIVREK